jgi:capsular polysaccharide biosynthesis protein
MELNHYLTIVRQRWLVVLAVPLLTLLLSGVVALLTPAEYTATARVLVTRGVADEESTAGISAGGEDATAQDLPAIVTSSVFRTDVAAAETQAGRPLSESDLRGVFTASTQGRAVLITAQASTPEAAINLARTAVAQLTTNGLRYWGDTAANPQQPGLNVGVLDLPNDANHFNDLRYYLRQIGLRVAAALIVGFGLAFLLHFLAGVRRQPHKEISDATR